MPFQARNSYYLRISTHFVLPLIVYLDETHIEWMSERTLQSVVADLKGLIGPKLMAERDVHLGPGGPANAKKGTVDVHRGETYQFAFFFKKADPHYVVLKTRNFRMEASKPQIRPPLRASKGRRAKRKRDAKKPKKTQSKSAGKRPRTTDDDDDDYFVSGTSSSEEAEEDVDEESVPVALEVEEEEEKPKAALELSYKQFDIQDRCICVIVEPSPSLSSVGQSNNPTSSTGDTQPLFLPERGQSIAPSMDVDESINRNENSNNFSLMEFSQALTSFADQAVGFEDDDEIEGDVLFADADEMRNVIQ